jgi:antitoxin MazE
VRKKLSAIGNSLGLVIEKPILELLKIDSETELDITTDGTRLIIEPVRSHRRKRLEESKRRVLKAHEKTFRRLAE